MPQTPGRHARKLEEATTLLSQGEALVVLAGLNDASFRTAQESLRTRLATLNNRQLDFVLADLAARLKGLTEVLRPSRPLSFYPTYLYESRDQRATKLFLPKWLLIDLLPGIGTIWTNITPLPMHAYVRIDLTGAHTQGAATELLILEAALFDDVCACSNRAEILAQSLVGHGPSDEHRELMAMRRATLLGSFYFLESYLNSIAFDHVFTHRGLLAPRDLDYLTEWDSARHSARYVSFRNKLLHYPRIILGLPSPPIQENNCPEAKYILQEVKDLRDAIVHANPRPDPLTHANTKSLHFWAVASSAPLIRPDDSESDPSSWRSAVDAAIVLVSKIETLLYGSLNRLFWLRHRSANGLFPPPGADAS